MIEYINFTLTAVSILFLILAFIYLLRQRILEDKRLLQGTNTLLFGLIFLGLFLIIEHIKWSNICFNLNWTFITTLSNISNLVFAPLMAVCFLVSICFFKEI